MVGLTECLAGVVSGRHHCGDLLIDLLAWLSGRTTLVGTGKAYLCRPRRENELKDDAASSFSSKIYNYCLHILVSSSSSRSCVVLRCRAFVEVPRCLVSKAKATPPNITSLSTVVLNASWFSKARKNRRLKRSSIEVMPAHATDPREISVQDLSPTEVPGQPAAPQNAGGSGLSGKQEHCMSSFSCLQTSPLTWLRSQAGTHFSASDGRNQRAQFAHCTPEIRRAFPIRIRGSLPARLRSTYIAIYLRSSCSRIPVFGQSKGEGVLAG